MDIINLLPEHIANQIAAGEVIQRPASVVKETLENSIDSGATEIQLIIKDSGKTLIQIIDNGCGMSKNDVEKCFLRHATSKIKKADDLFEIQTMGFRGEAMASIASISHVELETKFHDQHYVLHLIQLLQQEPLVAFEEWTRLNPTHQLKLMIYMVHL